MTATEIERAKHLVKYNSQNAIDPILILLDWLQKNQADKHDDPSIKSFLKNPIFWINFAKVAWRVVKLLILRSFK